MLETGDRALEFESSGEKKISQSKHFVSHPMLHPSSLEERKYQVELAKAVRERNTLAVLPTGLGKTAIALLVMAHYLSSDPGNCCLILAPTRVLVHQHYSFLRTHLALPPEEIAVITGEDQALERAEMWKKRVICSTPQVMESDIRERRCDIKKFCLIVFDEVHRAVGNHAYSTIGANYRELNPEGRIFGITASLPSDQKKVEEIVANLKISKIEVRDERDLDVKPYVFKTDVEWIELELGQDLKDVQRLIKEALSSRMQLLSDAALIKMDRSRPVSLKDLLRLRLKVDQIQSSQLRNALFSGIRLQHALNLLETQSLSTFRAFMNRLNERKRGYGMSELLSDSRIRLALQKTESALAHNVEHPKIAEVLKLCENVKQGERAIVFASYRDTVDQIYSQLTKHGLRAGYLIGKSGASGQTQKKQIQAIEELRNGVYDILVATQVGEEGLDIAECNLVIFYDNVPSAIRFVQRKGRTGRNKEGRICVFLTRGTKDEVYYWMSRKRLRDTKKAEGDYEKKQVKGPMDSFLRAQSLNENQLPIVYIDTRETAQFVDLLRHKGSHVEVRMLETGDFVVSRDVVIERKTMDDFVKSIYDGRLFKQLGNMSEKYPRPILIIQGERKDLRGIGESAFYGALASIVSDFRVPVFFAPSERDVVEIIYHIARREQSEKNKETRIRDGGRKPVTLADSQRYVVAGIPGVDAVLADKLLAKLKTVEHLFSSSEQELRSVEGIGEVTAARIRQLASAIYVPTKSDSETYKAGEPSDSSSIDAYNEFWAQLAKRVKEEEVGKKGSKEEIEREDIPPPTED